MLPVLPPVSCSPRNGQSQANKDICLGGEKGHLGKNRKLPMTVEEPLSLEQKEGEHPSVPWGGGAGRTGSQVPAC